MADFNPEHKTVLDDLLPGHPLVQPGKMFGFPAYYAGGKLCIGHLRHTRSLGAAAHPGQHLFLQVNANDPPPWADQPRQGDRKVAHAAAEIERGFARLQ